MPCESGDAFLGRVAAFCLPLKTKTTFVRALLFCFLFLFSTNITVAQVPDDSTLVAAYNQALNDNWEHFRNLFGKEKRVVYSDFLKPKHLSESNQKHFKIVKEKDLSRRCKRIFIPRKSINAYRINHTKYQDSNDTIDVLISVRTFRCLKRNHVGVMVDCGGDMGYLPDGRLVFNRGKNSWDYIAYKTLYEDWIAKELEWLKRQTKSH